ncbi:MAG: hypothetical protein WCO45_03120 [Pseudanabaena sp. ELA607]|jgi:hypothetical protein
MNKPDDLEERFRQLEQEVMKNRPPAGEPNKRAEPEVVGMQQGVETAKQGLAGLVEWINSLTGPVKVIAIVVLGLITFSLLNFVFKAVMAIISISIMALVGYVLYKLFFESNNPKTP